MDRLKIAKELAKLGKSDAKTLRLARKERPDCPHLALIEENRVRRCAILTEVAQRSEVDLPPEEVPAIIERKD